MCTHEGGKVDLSIELEDSFVAAKIKSGPHVLRTDSRHLRDPQPFLDRPLRKSLIVSMDPGVRKLTSEIIALPAHWLLGCE